MAPRYVIVGASMAGATAAITLREEGADGTVTLIGAENELPYERPPLSKAYLRGDVPFDKALVRPAAFYAEHGIETMLGIRVTRIDPSARFVELEDHRRVPFDALQLATVADPDTLLAVDEAVTALEARDVQLGEQARLRLFAGLDEAEVAATLQVSERTARRDWLLARAFLQQRICES